MVPSSSGPGRLVLIQKIKGSTPFGITIQILKNTRKGCFLLKKSLISIYYSTLY